MGTPSEQLIGLAPERLERRRATRYRADEVAVPLASFTAEERETLVALYRTLSQLHVLLQTGPAQKGPRPLLDFIDQQGFAQVIRRVQRLGRDTHDPALAVIAHDVRGGALNALVLQLSRIGPTGLDPAITASIAFLVRDHRKMMRGLVADLDPASRERDLEMIPHSLSTLIEALRDFPAQAAGAPVEIEVDVAFEATIAESCVECGAIDRVAYNLLNNAIRHAQPPKVTVLFRRAGEDLRVVVQNTVSTSQQELLQKALGDGALFGSFSTTGSGQGLQIVSYLVGSAYGVPDTAELVDGGYVGAQLRGDLFSTWFHWPLSGA